MATPRLLPVLSSIVKEYLGDDDYRSSAFGWLDHILRHLNDNPRMLADLRKYPNDSVRVAVHRRILAGSQPQVAYTRGATLFLGRHWQISFTDVCPLGAWQRFDQETIFCS